MDKDEIRFVRDETQIRVSLRRACEELCRVKNLMADNASLGKHREDTESFYEDLYQLECKVTNDHEDWLDAQATRTAIKESKGKKHAD